VLVPVILAALVVLQTGWFRDSTSMTVDETLNLGLSLNALHEGSLDRGMMHLGTAPLPIVVSYLPALWRVTPQLRAHPWIGQPGDSALIARPRLLTTLTTLVPLVIVAYFWLEARRGRFAAALGAGLMAFSPTLLAHASLATHDAAFALHATLAMLAIGWYWQAPDRTRLVVSALTTSFALGAKYTGVLLIACFLVVLLAQYRQARLASEPSAGPLWRVCAKRGLLFLLLVFAFTWALHGFQWSKPGRWINFPPQNAGAAQARSPGRALDRLPNVRLSEPAFLHAIRSQIRHNRNGHAGFLMGMHSTNGWWWYFPFTILVKSTLPELILVLAGVAVLVASIRARSQKPTRDPYRRVMLIFGVLLLTALINSRINIGHRYTIALYPIAILATIDLTAEWGSHRRRWLRPAGTVLLGLQALACLTAAPRYLSYFNGLAGGPEQGWKYLADSNIDWGQDLPALRDILHREGYRRVAIDYFGTANLQGYGIEADRIIALSRPLAEYDALAISVTRLQSVYPKGPETAEHVVDSYTALRAFPPAHRAGDSIFVYDLHSPDTRAAFLSAAESVAQRVVPSQIASRKPPSVSPR
jgi:Ca2+/Na+ antiporter